MAGRINGRADWATVPNLLTMLRGILCPLVFVLLVSHSTLAVLVYVTAAVTDLIDGWYARRFNQESWLGKMMDPIVDKLLAASVLIGLSITQPELWVLIPAAVIIVREIAVAILVQVYMRRGTPLHVTWSGKVKTVAHGVAFTLMMLPLGGIWLAAARVVITVAVVLTITSGFDYFQRARVVSIG